MRCRRAQRGLALFAVLILVVLGAVVAAATLMTAESSTMASRSTNDAVDRMLRVRSALALAAVEVGPQRDGVLGGGGVRVARRPLESLGDERWRVVWSASDGRSRRGGPVDLMVGTGLLAELASLRSGGGASAWEPEIRAAEGRSGRLPLAEVVAAQAPQFAALLDGVDTRGGVVEAMQRAGADASQIAAVLDAARFGEAEFAVGRVDINRGSAEEIAAAGLAIDDAEAIVRARSRRSPGERSSVYWPIASGSIDDVEVCVAALDGLTTRTLQWMVGGAVVADGSDSDWPVVAFRGVVDLSGEVPRWVCVGLDGGAVPAGGVAVVDSELDVALEAEPVDVAGDGFGSVLEVAPEQDGDADGVDESDAVPVGLPMSRWSGAKP